MNASPRPAAALRVLVPVLGLALAATGCGGSGDPAGPSPTTASATPSPTPPPPQANPVTKPLPAEQWQKIVQTGAWREGCPATQADLRRVEVNYWDFNGELQRGVLVVNKDITASISRIFTRLFDTKFQIERMESVEAYQGDNNASMKANNTAAYNCRKDTQINAPVAASPHANGRAIDINPVQNPWKDLRCTCWSPSAEFAGQTEGKGIIAEGSPAWQAFMYEGWVWQNIRVPDYMHFDTGYPSAPYTGVPPKRSAAQDALLSLPRKTKPNTSQKPAPTGTPTR
ncbi:M15 family metallopeptidase [Streptomyces sp. IBSNAI002]|uniref:M15 family metallopeptidase n=1 Tax=Streptomyces sp. IBSNAI002 TaxID=3457500 RepID=UPI003FD277FC